MTLISRRQVLARVPPVASGSAVGVKQPSDRGRGSISHLVLRAECRRSRRRDGTGSLASLVGPLALRAVIIRGACPSGRML